MSVRSLLILVAGLSVVGTLVIDDASAFGRRLKKRMSRCGVSRSASWGGSYGSVGSCGTPVVPVCRTTCTVVVHSGASFGSSGGSGGSYTSAGSVGGWVVPASDVTPHATYATPNPTPTPTPEPIATPQDSFPREVIVPEFGDEGDAGHKSDATPHHHIHTPPKTSQHVPGQPTESRIASSAAKHAFLMLRDVPIDAEIYLLGTKMTARGALRRYRIPVDAMGQAYDYEIELKLPGQTHLPAIATTKVRAGETTELRVGRSGDQLVFIDKQHTHSESGPLAVR